MPSPGDIRAGGVYVEIGATLNALNEGLKNASAKLKTWASDARANVQAFGEGLESVGTRMLALGGTMLAPLALAAKQYADYGENVGKLASKTGMSEAALAGLSYAAQSSGIAVGAVAIAVKGMQRAIVDGSKDSQSALAKLGTSSAELKKLSPDQQFSAMAEGLSRVADPAERGMLAQQLFGRSAQELLPILEQGAAGLARFKAEAQTLGLAPATENANKLDDAFDRLEGGIKGLMLSIGAQLAPVLTPLVARVTDIVIALREWISTDQALIIEWAKIGVELTAAGVAFVALGAGIAAVMSPLFLTTATVVGLGAALLAVLDVLGVTQTGFGEVFNAIRVDGTGLATWFGAFFLWISKAWNEVTSNLGISWDVVSTGIKTMWNVVIGAVAVGIGTLMTAFGQLVSYADAAINGIIEIWNKLAGKLHLPTIDLRSNVGGTIAGEGEAITASGNGMLNKADADRAGLSKRISDSLLNRDLKNAALEKQMQGLFGADAQDNTTGISIDTGRLKKGISQVGDNIWNSFSGLVSGALGNFNVPKHEWGGATPAASAIASAQTWQPAEMSVAGTFSGYAGAQMGASGIFQKQLQAAEQQLEAQKQIERNTRPGESGGLS